MNPHHVPADSAHRNRLLIFGVGRVQRGPLTNRRLDLEVIQRESARQSAVDTRGDWAAVGQLLGD
eukprot:scaffold152644_cov61-Cyclotella_meneghiniana.AAC.1